MDMIFDDISIKDEPLDEIEHVGADDQIFEQISPIQQIQLTKRCDADTAMKDEIGIEEESFSFEIEDNKNSEAFKKIFGMNEKRGLLDVDAFDGKMKMELRNEGKGIENYDREELGCSNCNFVFESKDELKSHLGSCCEGKIKCFKCSSTCDCESSLKFQVLKNINTDQSISKTNLFKCSKCSYECNQEGSLKQHMLGHQNPKLFKCSVCSYQSNYKKDLSRHMLLIHKKITLFKCFDCSYQCHYKRDFSRHMRTHQNPKLFKCSECGNEYKSKNTLKIHLLKHQNIRLFKCSDCSYDCNYKKDLLRHMLTHQNTKFKCSQCSYECNYKGHLNRHILRHQRDALRGNAGPLTQGLGPGCLEGVSWLLVLVPADKALAPTQ